VDLDGHEESVERFGDLDVLERLLLHDVAPVAGRVADGEEDRHVARPGLRERLVAPWPPVHRVVRVLLQVRAGLERYTIHEPRRAAPVEVRGARRTGTPTARTRGGH